MNVTDAERSCLRAVAAPQLDASNAIIGREVSLFAAPAWMEPDREIYQLGMERIRMDWYGHDGRAPNASMLARINVKRRVALVISCVRFFQESIRVMSFCLACSATGFPGLTRIDAPGPSMRLTIRCIVQSRKWLNVIANFSSRVVTVAAAPISNISVRAPRTRAIGPSTEGRHAMKSGALIGRLVRGEECFET